MRKANRYPLIAAALVLGAGLAGCGPKEGPVEKAGKKVDKAVERAGEKIEKAGEKIQDTAKGK